MDEKNLKDLELFLMQQSASKIATLKAFAEYCKSKGVELIPNQMALAVHIFNSDIVNEFRTIASGLSFALMLIEGFLREDRRDLNDMHDNCELNSITRKNPAYPNRPVHE